MASIFITCPLSGITYTVTCSYNAQLFASRVFPGLHLLASQIEKERWKMPSDMLVGAILYNMEKKGLLSSYPQEKNCAGIVNSILCAHFPAAKLYYLYTQVRDSNSNIKVEPFKLNLSTLLSSSPSTIYDMILSTVKQELTGYDKEVLYRTTMHSPKKTKTERRDKYGKMDLESIVTRLSRKIPVLMALIQEQLPDQAPDYYIPEKGLGAKLGNATRFYDDLSDTKKSQYKELVSELFSISLRNNLIHQDGVDYRSYKNFFSLIEKSLSTSTDHFWLSIS